MRKETNMEQNFHYPEKTRTLAALLKLVCKKNIFKEKYIDKTGGYDLVIPVKTMAKLFNMDHKNLSEKQIDSIMDKTRKAFCFNENIIEDGEKYCFGYNIISSVSYEPKIDIFGIRFSDSVLKDLFTDCI